jgi:Ca2+-binding RTX toxin-like protein
MLYSKIETAFGSDTDRHDPSLIATWRPHASTIASQSGGAPGGPQSFEGPVDEIPSAPFQGRPLAIGGSDTGVINTGGDRDGFAVELIAGQSYVFTLTATGASPLTDPFLELYGSGGVVLAIDDDGGPGRNSVLRFTAQETGTYYINAMAWDAFDPADGPPTITGDYTITADIGPPQNPLDTIDFGFTLPSTNISVYFATGGETFNDTTASRSWAANEITAAMAAMATFSAVTSLTFTQVLSSVGATFIMSLAELEPNVLGQFSSTGTGGFGVFDPTNSSWSAAQLLPGGEGFVTIMHEVGHGLGMAHPHDNGGFDPDDSSEIMEGVTTAFDDGGTYGLNTGYATIMTYNTTNELTPGTFDIALMQQKYGVNTTTNSGDNVYTIPTISVGAGSPAVIWDTGGIDTISFGGTGDARIDLRTATLRNELEGAGFQSVARGSNGAEIKGFVIAHGVVIENATGGGGVDVLTGNAAANVLTGNDGNDSLKGLEGADTLLGGGGTDFIQYDLDPAGISVNLLTQIAIDGWGTTDTLGSIESVEGSRFNDTIIGGTGGPLGVSNLSGGDGDDYIEDNSTIQADLAGGAGNDRIIGGVVRAFISGGFGDDYLTGGDGGNFFIDGGDGNDLVSGGARDETLYGGSTNDTGIDTVTYENATAGVVVSLAITIQQNTIGAGVDVIQGFENLTGSAFNDNLTGDAFNNVITGGAGADAMAGGLGDDLYLVDDAGDTIFELENEGSDRVLTSVTYLLSVHIEDLTLSGAGNINGSGNFSDNQIEGNSGNNVLSGFSGNDTLIGGAGNDRLDGATGIDLMTGGTGDDIYFVESLDDVVTEDLNAGTDRIDTLISYALGANIENLLLTGTANLNGSGNFLTNVMSGNSGANSLFGGSGNDTLFGNDGNDRLDGAFGDDVMKGGFGDDIYIVDSVGDTVTDEFNGGLDRVDASVSYTLGGNIENLVLAGTANISGSGNFLANTIVGNAGNNNLFGGTGNDTLFGNDGNDRLDGSTGDDILKGGFGDDIYIVDSVGDVVTDEFNGGLDRVDASVSYTLGSNVENLVLAGTANINGTGNFLANTMVGNSGANSLYGGTGDDVLFGNDGNDRLDGATGNDTMKGGLGDDIYIVDSVSDTTTEDINQGTDRIDAFVSFTIGVNIENMVLQGTGNINGTGNFVNNTIIGNSGDNILAGLGGNDTLLGGAGNDQLDGSTGNDRLTGGAGADKFVFSTALNATGVDQILDFNVAEDVIWLDDAVFTAIGTGVLAASAFTTGSAAADASDRVIYDPTTGALYYDADGSGGGAAVQIATLSTGLALTEANIFGI